MGVINRFKAKLTARKEKRLQIEALARPQRLANLEKEINHFKAKKEERNLVDKVKSLRLAERQARFKPLKQGLARAKDLTQKASGFTTRAVQAQGNKTTLKVAEARRNELFGTPNKNDLFTVNKK